MTGKSTSDTGSSERSVARKTHTDTIREASPMAGDHSSKKSERRRVPTVKMCRDNTEMNVEALDVEAHSRMGWKLAAGE